MVRPTSKYPTELELQILKVLWHRGPSPVSEVREALSGFRKLAHTSVITIMNIMVEKRYLSRRKVGGSYVYSPRISEPEVTGGMLSDLVDRVFDGSAETVMLNLLEKTPIDREKLDRLRELVERKLKESQQ